MENDFQKIAFANIKPSKIDDFNSRFIYIENISKIVKYEVEKILNNRKSLTEEEFDLLKQNMVRGIYLGKLLKKKLKNIDKLEIPGFKDGKYIGNDYVDIDNNPDNITPEKIVQTFTKGLEYVSDELGDIFWILLSSGSMFTRKQNFKKIPGDIDIAMSRENFINIVNKKIFSKENKNCKKFKYTRVDNIYKTIDNPNEIEDLLNKGLLRMEFIYYYNSTGINIELFPEMPGNGLIQPGTMTLLSEIVKIYNDLKSTTNALPDKRLTQSYFANLVKEFGNDRIFEKEKKIKGSIRMQNILKYLDQNGITNINQVMLGAKKYINEYIKHGSAAGINDKEFEGYLEGIRDNLKESMIFLKKLKNHYKVWKIMYENKNLTVLDDHNTFIGKTRKYREVLEYALKDIKKIIPEDIITKVADKNFSDKELHDLIIEIPDMSKLEKKLFNILHRKIYNILYLDDGLELEEDGDKRGIVSRIEKLKDCNMLDPENIAYFSEIFILEDNYLKYIEQLFIKINNSDII